MSNHLTREFYDQVQTIANVFNRSLFDSELPPTLLTLAPGLESLGHFSLKRWRGASGQTVGEIRLNPALFGECSWLQLFQTVVHQQCHLWQHTRGTPSRPGYHNSEWATKMRTIGLVPTTTGKPGGRMTGQRVEDYPAPDGLFIRVCADLIQRKNEFQVGTLWPDGCDPRPLVSPPVKLKLSSRVEARLLSRVASWAKRRDHDELDLAAAKRKIKYACPRCHARVWGRIGLRILCQACNRPLECDRSDRSK